MTPIEIIAFAGAIIVPVKIIMLLNGQKFWFETITEKYWGNAVAATMLSLLAVAVLLFFLLQELTIIQVWAGAIFGMALTSLVLAPFSNRAHFFQSATL
jgi:small-conductance mechanosensitive channel